MKFPEKKFNVLIGRDRKVWQVKMLCIAILVCTSCLLNSCSSGPKRDTSTLQKALLGHWRHENGLAYLKFSDKALTYLGSMNWPPSEPGSYVIFTDLYKIDHASEVNKVIKLSVIYRELVPLLPGSTLAMGSMRTVILSHKVVFNKRKTSFTLYRIERSGEEKITGTWRYVNDEQADKQLSHHISHR